MAMRPSGEGHAHAMESMNHALIALGRYCPSAASGKGIGLLAPVRTGLQTVEDWHETSPSKFAASGRWRRRSAGSLALGFRASLSDAASAHHRRICPQWCYRNNGALDRTMAVGASRSTVYRRE